MRRSFCLSCERRARCRASAVTVFFLIYIPVVLCSDTMRLIFWVSYFRNICLCFICGRLSSRGRITFFSESRVIDSSARARFYRFVLKRRYHLLILYVIRQSRKSESIGYVIDIVAYCSRLYGVNL